MTAQRPNRRCGGYQSDTLNKSNTTVQRHDHIVSNLDVDILCNRDELERACHIVHGAPTG